MSGWGWSLGHLPGFSFLPEPGLASEEINAGSLLVSHQCQAGDCHLGGGPLPGKMGPDNPSGHTAFSGSWAALAIPPRL